MGAATQELEREIAELRQRNAELQILYETIRDLTSTLSLRGVLGRLLRRALQHLDAEVGSILLLGKGTLRIMASEGLPADVVSDSEVPVGKGISGYVAATGEPLLVTDIETDPRFRRRNRERYYTSSFISAPLLHVGAVRGVININNKRSRIPFRREDLRLLQALAGHASVALANAHEYEAMLERAQRDSLTGLANHGHMWQSLEQEFLRAERHERSLALVMLDIDHFKEFNDALGHPAGDDALIRVARQLEAASRGHDVVARYGGEEFAAILPETGLEGARIYAEKIRQAVAKLSFGTSSAPRHLTISAGCAASGADVRSPRDLLALADRRLYHAKNAGRDRVCAED